MRAQPRPYALVALLQVCSWLTADVPLCAPPCRCLLQDYNWAVNWWFIPCERVSFLPHGSKVRAFSATYRPSSSLDPSLLPTPSDRVMV